MTAELVFTLPGPETEAASWHAASFNFNTDTWAFPGEVNVTQCRAVLVETCHRAAAVKHRTSLFLSFMNHSYLCCVISADGHSFSLKE